MQLTDYVDCLIPRGGPVADQEHPRATRRCPSIIDGDGNCHVYVDASADLDEAFDIVVNAKTQRPSVCNAAESLVVHEAVADALLPRARRRARPREGSSSSATPASRQRVPDDGRGDGRRTSRSEFLALQA